MLGLPAVKADPTGGTVVAGAATINSNGISTTINQSTNRALINWDSFSIAAGGTVRFNQPNSAAIAVNRVTGAQPSSIYGNLLANGQVWLINGNGILFGKGSQVNVGGLIATTSDIADRDFAAGNFSFGGGTGASVVNQGTLRARNGGSVVLSGAGVANQGLIQADAGTVVLGGASAFTVDFDGDNLLRYAITAPAGKADNGESGVSNSGTIKAGEGGRVLMTARAAADVAGSVINNTGIVVATSARVQNGEVVLDGGDGDVAVGGTIDASGAGSGQSGGAVSVAGRNVTVADNTRIDVSGQNGGGTVRIGGDVHGAGPLPNAANVHVGSATITADATRRGKGGSLVVWSNGLTDFSGVFSATGGSAGGDGGFIETSGHRLHVGDGAKVDTSAAHGRTGTWLLDPDYLYIENDGDTPIEGGAVSAGDHPGQDAFVAPSTIIGALATTNVRLEAVYDINVLDAVIYNSPNALSLLAREDIYISANVQNAGSGAIDVIAGWDGETTDRGYFTAPGVYGATGGSVFVTADPETYEAPLSQAGEAPAVAIGSAGGTTTVAGWDVNVLGGVSSSQIGYVGAGGGDIVVRATHDVVLDGTEGYGAVIGNNAVGVIGDATGNIDIRATGTLGLYRGDTDALVWIGNTAGDDGAQIGNVTLVAGSGDGDVDFSRIVTSGLVGGDFTLGLTDDDLSTGLLEYHSAHTLNLLSAGDLVISESVQNSGSGAINLVAGWDGETLDPAHFGDDGVYGNNVKALVDIGGPDSEGDVFVGAAEGALNIYAKTLLAEAWYGNVQVGYHGAGGGDINVHATHDVVLSAEDDEFGTFSVMIGNGALDGSVDGLITGNIFVQAGGELSLEIFTGEGCECGQLPPDDRGGSVAFLESPLLGIGNAAAPDAPEAAGDVKIFSASVYEDEPGTFAGIIGADLGYGDVTVGHLGDEESMQVDGDLGYDSAHALTLLSASDIAVTGHLQNAGSGAITLIAGWDGSTLDPAHLTDVGHFGLNNGSVTIGGSGAAGSVAIGTGSGVTTIAGHNVAVEAVHGYAQIGHDGGGGSGAIFVYATENLHLSATQTNQNSDHFQAQIGNGGVFAAGNNGGDITIAVGGNVTLAGGTGNYNYAQIGNGGDSASSGSNSGNITVTAGGAVSLTGKDDYAQIGNGGFGSFNSDSGNVTVVATGNVALTGAGAWGYAQIGNGGQHSSSTASGTVSVSSGAALSLDSNGQNGFAMIGNGDGQRYAQGSVSGLVTVEVAGTTTLDDAGGSLVWLGNRTAAGGTIAGDLSVVTGTFSDPAALLTGMILSGLSGGNVTVGTTGSDLTLADAIVYSSGHALSLLSAQDVIIENRVSNDGAGDVNVVAGWDGTTLAPAHFGDADVFGNDGGSILVGGEGAEGDAAIGAAQGALHLYGADLDVDAIHGFAQVGYHGAGGGDIFVTMTHDVTAHGGDAVGEAAEVYFAQIGNGSLADDVEGDITGNIVMTAGNETGFYWGAHGPAWLGNAAGEGFIETGDVTALTRSGFFSGDYIAADLGTAPGTGGNVFLGFTDPAVSPLYIGGLAYSSPNDFVFAGAGSMNVTGQVSNAGSGDVTLVAGWDGHTVGSAAELQAAHAYGGSATIAVGNAIQYQDVSVGSAGGRTTLLTGDLTVAPKAGFYAQVGYHGATGGDISVVADGDVTLTGGAALHDYAMIGNGSLNGDVVGNVTGNIDIRAGGVTTVSAVPGNAPAWIGNVAADGYSATGNLLLVSGSYDVAPSFASMISADLAGGDVTIGATDPEAAGGVSVPAIYNSSHTLNLLFAGSIGILASIQNGGSGAINIVAGWDGVTLDPAHFFDPGVYGNNDSVVLVGSQYAAGDVAIGSFGGTTTIAGASITVAGVNGYAQVGYRGLSGGAIGLHASGAVTLAGGESASHWAQVGNGLVFGANDAGGDVGIAAASIQGGSRTAVTGAHLDLVTTDGDIGAADAALRFASHSLEVSTSGDSVFLTSPDDGTTFSGSGVNTGGGAFSLAAGGAIGQTAAIHTGSLNLSTTSGDITLTHFNNSFGALTVSTLGNATFRHNSVLTVAGATIGGKLSLTAGRAIRQTGAIVAASLDATIASGALPDGALQQLISSGIVLTNAGNSFGTLTLSVPSVGGPANIGPDAGDSFGAPGSGGAGDASIVDSTGVVLAGADLTGTLTLAAGGAVSQTGAIHAGALDVSTTTGTILLNNAGNAFGTLSVLTHGSDGASFTDSAGLTLAGATVGGTLTLAAGGPVGQSGAIHAASLSVSTSTGAIVLNDAGNAFAALSVLTHGADNASVTDSSGLTVATAGVGGKLTLSAGGAIGQSGAIAAHGLVVSTSAGAIALTNTANAVIGPMQFVTPGALAFYNTLSIGIGASSIGGDVTLLSKGNVNLFTSLQSVAGNITVVAGWDGTTIAPAAFGNAGVYGNNTGPMSGNIVIGGTGATGAVAVGSQHGSTSLYANNVAVLGVNGAAQLGYHGTGGGAISVRTLHDLTVGASAFTAMVGNGSLANDVLGDIGGDIDVRLGGVAVFNGTVGGAAKAWFGNVAHSGTATGNVIIVAADVDGTQDNFSDFVAADIVGGDVTLGFTGGGDQGTAAQIAYSSTHALNILTSGNFIVAGLIQNTSSGAINVVGGWDGHTLDAAAFGSAGVYGNNGNGVLIGGSDAPGNAALGSAGGTTSVYGAALALNAQHGFAQLGFNGHGAGAIFVKVGGSVTVAGGAGAGQFAQIGNGGRAASGNNSGGITIAAGGDVALNGGGGSEAYAQIGQGGAESNTGANGYSNVAPVTVSAANVLLDAGAGSAAYAMIGNGGYKAGLNLAGGTASNGGAITVTSGHAVSLLGNGADAFAQIGNGGGLSNFNAAAAAGGSDSGDVVVHAPNGAAGSVTLAAGAGANAYAQIGNGGYGANSGPTSTAANFTITGNVTVTDLALSGGNGGPNAYSQIGNGDVSHNSFGSISGNIVIDANGQITYTPGTAPHSQATIGNFTGQGTVSGSLTGANPPTELANNPVVIGVTASNTANNGAPNNVNTNITTIQTLVVVPEQPTGASAVTLETTTPSPLAALEGEGGGDGETPNASDGATVVIADSLDGAKKAGSQTILAGMLKSTSGTGGTAPHGVPPADQDFSSWGNEALWQ
ncbi:MAG: filamentous hemagglutinin N-terminal domain-containing protein [Rhizomicrobium sp.]